MGPTLSFRGLDNASYYRLVPDNPTRCVNFTGTGNTLNLSHPRVLQMVMDSLRYWVTSFHVDGFRFDLGVTLGREANRFRCRLRLLRRAAQDPTLAHVKLISEPWDLGPGGYQLGQHPPGFAEWNDQFRDGVRRFWRGDGGQRPDFAARLAGSSDLFDRWARRPWASVNYAASHDGFTLADTVSYVERHNEANGENNQDGAGENYSANWGVEGPTDDPKIVNTRARVLRAMLATVFFAHGTPMLLAGDEFGRTQRGNNNAYCQDNDISWIDWEQARSSEAEALKEFRCPADRTAAGLSDFALSNVYAWQAATGARSGRYFLVRPRRPADLRSVMEQSKRARHRAASRGPSQRPRIGAYAAAQSNRGKRAVPNAGTAGAGAGVDRYRTARCPGAGF